MSAERAIYSPVPARPRLVLVEEVPPVQFLADLVAQVEDGVALLTVALADLVAAVPS